MNIVEFIDKQTQVSRQLTKNLISDIPDDLWYTVPEGINSNIAWQIGHLIISQSYHSVLVITDNNKQILDTIPMLDYVKKYSFNSKAGKEDQPVPDTLRNQLDLVNKIARCELQKLTMEDLDKPLEPTRMPHPIAKTKYEALTWNFRHEMWHCGQIAMIKRGMGLPIVIKQIPVG
ncbi:MAG: DinB family protein [Ignavibacteriae bacterium]|nr:MAG: DinB family protein [Ignavibacteriota bacterium]